jgi:hypothetical protein
MAGEDLVLANLIINADGTVTGVNRAGQAITSLERQATPAIANVERRWSQAGTSMGRISNRLADGFLNIRRLISGLFIGFSVGGIVFALASMIREIVASTEAFQNLKRSIVDFLHQLIISESAVDSFGRHLKALGVTSAGDVALKMKQLNEEIAKGQALLAAGFREDVTGFTAEGFHIAGENIKLTGKEMEILRKNIANAREELVKLQKQFDEMGTITAPFVDVVPTGFAGSKDIRAFINAIGTRFTEEELPFRTESIIGDMRIFASEIGEVNSQLDFLREGLISGDVSFQDFMDSMTSGQETLTQYGTSLLPSITDNVRALTEAFEAGRISSADFTAGMEAQGRGIEAIVVKLEQWRLILGAVADAASAAADAGIGSMKRAWQAQQLLLAIEATQRGLLEIAHAVAAAAAGNYGAAALHYVAATLYFAVAAFRGLAASRGPQSAGGGGGRGGRGFREAPTEKQIGPQRAPQEFHIYLDGVKGFIGTREEIGRAMAELLGEAARDNART